MDEHRPVSVPIEHAKDGCGIVFDISERGCGRRIQHLRLHTGSNVIFRVCGSPADPVDNNMPGKRVLVLLQSMVVFQRIFTGRIIEDFIIRQIRKRFIHNHDHIDIFSLPIGGLRLKVSRGVLTVVVGTNRIVFRHIIGKAIRESQLIVDSGNIEFIFYVKAFKPVFGRHRQLHYRHCKDHGQDCADDTNRPVAFHSFS